MSSLLIGKSATNTNNYKVTEYYYNSARSGMLDLFKNMVGAELADTLFLPGYIGWSPKEGSGIFDPVSNLTGLNVEYYKITSDLEVDFDDFKYRLSMFAGKKIAVLIVNYFGFIDRHIKQLSSEIRKYSGWIIEDNAHGFFTSLYSECSNADATFFSLHKMFPFVNGGSLRLMNDRLKGLEFCGENIANTKTNPWVYDVHKIAVIRKENYEVLQALINEKKYKKLFKPVKKGIRDGIVPQTFPVRILTGNRDRIYRILNESGYGVVSLYHTLIEPLRTDEFHCSLDLSKKILNLPVHQDVDQGKYPGMIKMLAKCCENTAIDH